jgi:hypothetical protein
MRCNIFSQNCILVLVRKTTQRHLIFNVCRRSHPRGSRFSRIHPRQSLEKRCLYHKNKGKDTSRRARSHIRRQRIRAAPEDTRRARACTPPPVPVPRRPCSRFVSRVLYTPVELEELRNISCKSVLQGTIYSAIILFVANWAALYAGASSCSMTSCSASEPPAYPLTNYHIYHIQQTC